MHTWVDIATLTKKRNTPGRFVARCQTNLLLCLEPGLDIAFVPPALDAPRNATIAEVTKTGDTTAEITFDYQDGPWTSAQEDELVGMHCLVLRDRIDQEVLLDEDEQLVGYEVVDHHEGTVGVVREVLHNPGQSLLVLSRTKDESELLVPFVSQIVLAIDDDSCTIQVDLPSGLLDL